MKIGVIGYRGMVGSVLLERMAQEKDLEGLDAVAFSTSQAGAPGPKLGEDNQPVGDAYDLTQLKSCDVLISCQGSEYTKKILPALRQEGYRGYWLDASSALRMEGHACIVLDPINRNIIEQALSDGVLDYIGGNCTVSLMLMGLAGLFRQGWIEWMTSMSYQAASGAGAKQMRELVQQMRGIGNNAAEILDNPAADILALDRSVQNTIESNAFPTEYLGAPLAGSVLPWIDTAVENGATREEWKAYAEANKILGTEKSPIVIDGVCVRVGIMRCHAQACTVKLRQDIPLEQIEAAIAQAHQWVKVVPNDKSHTLSELTPAAVSGTLKVPVGRIHKLRMGPTYVGLFTVGDQLLWGAAEPLRRMLVIIREHLGK